jgi:hypothetical protein
MNFNKVFRLGLERIALQNGKLEGNAIEKDLHDDNFEEFLINMMLVELQEMQKLVGAPKKILSGSR